MGLLVKNKNRKLRKLVKRIEILRNNLTYVEEEVLRRLLLFRQAVADYCFANNLPLQKNMFDKQGYEHKPPSNKSRSVTKFVKKLYREIATLTHPDKTDDPELNEIFVKCSTALSNGFIYDIIESATKLDITITSVSISELVFLHEEISELETSIKENQNTYCWVWFEKNKDERYIKQFLNLQ